MMSDKQLIESLMTALEPMPDNHAKIQYIWNVARNSSIHMDPSDFHEWIKRVVATTKDGLTVPFCKELQEFWGDRRGLCGLRGAQNLAHGVVLNLTDCLIADRRTRADLNYTVLWCFFNQAIFFCQLLTKTESMGAAGKLLRLFGELASTDLRDRLLRENLADPKMSKEIRDAISEGFIKSIGAHLVLQVFLGTAGEEGTGQYNAGETEAIKAEIRLLCANRGTDIDRNLTRRNGLLARLGYSFGDEEEAQKWFASEFPDMVRPLE